MTLRIGPLTVDPPVVLAPMAGVTDAPFRGVCSRFGAGLYVSEMITARALVARNGAFVTPAIGASTTGAAGMKSPIRTSTAVDASDRGRHHASIQP